MLKVIDGKQYVPIDEERVTEVMSDFQPILQGYAENKQKFLTVKEAQGRVAKHITNIKKAGKHRKVLGKKMRAKLNNDVKVDHIKNKRTFIISRMQVERKRKLWIDYVVINYYSGKGGIVYALQGSVCDSTVIFFTAHFFDRLAQRGYGTNPLDRIGTVKTFLLDFAVAQMEMGFSLYNHFNLSTKIYLGHGVGVGEYLPLIDDGSLNPPGSTYVNKPENRITVVKMSTYLTPEMIDPELLKYMEKGRDFILKNPLEGEQIRHLI